MSLTIRLLDYLSTRSRRSIWIMSVLTVLVVGTIDHATGTVLAMALFYLLPISVASWSLGRRPGIFIAVLSTIALEASEALSGDAGLLLIVWNGTTRLGVFLIVASLIAEFRHLLSHQIELSLTDPLTDARNRRAFQEAAEHELQAMRRHHQPLSFGFMDVDNFKTVNDTLGHAAGDRVLITVAETLRAKLRGADVMARLGGDEFGILMPQTDASGARKVIPRLIASLAEEIDQQDWPVRFSVGVVSCVVAPSDVDTLIRLGDTLMYAAKRAGKNRIEYGLYPDVSAESDAAPAVQVLPGSDTL